MVAVRPLVTVLLILLGLSNACASVIEIPGDVGRVDLGSRIMHYVDRTCSREIADLADDEGAFHSLAAEKLNQGYTRDCHWLRFKFQNSGIKANEHWLEIGHARLQSAKMFWREGMVWNSQESGTHTPRINKPVVAVTPVFPLTLAPGETREVFVRLSSETTIDMSAMLWDPLAFRSNEGTYLLTKGAFLSALALASTFALFVYLLMREKTFLLFGLALAFQTVYESCMNGILPLYFWPERLPFETAATTLCSGFSVFFHALFLRSFLNLRQTLKFADRLMIMLAAVASISAIAAVFHDYRLWAKVVSLDVIVIVVVAPLFSFILLRRGFRPALFLIYGLSILWVAVFVSQLTLLGWLPTHIPAAESIPLATVLASALILLAITERAREFRDALARANAANEAKVSFLAHMSHELRTPLNTVIGFGRMLRKGSRVISPPDAGDAIERSGLHLLSMIDELLDYSRSELGRLPLCPAPTAWREFIDTLSGAALVLAERSGNRFALEIDDKDYGTLIIDARRLRQVLDNLLSNASRHTHAGTIRLTCHSEPGSEQGNVRLHFRVIDSGGGVAADEIDRIFEPYQRGSRQPSASEGAGLGLAIARQLVSQMGGDLRLEETSSSGSVFGFCIECPVLDEMVALPRVEDVLFRLHAEETVTVLIVEDSSESRRLLAHSLNAAGFAVLEAVNGREAIDLMGGHVNLILTDQFMLDGDGWSVLRAARGMSPTLPVILVSAADQCRPPGFPEDINFDGVVAKPVDERFMFELIERLLRYQGRVTCKIAHIRPSESLLPPRYLADFEKFVKEGSLTDIDDWATTMASEFPESSSFIQNVRDAMIRLDFKTLEQLAGSCRGQTIK